MTKTVGVLVVVGLLAGSSLFLTDDTSAAARYQKVAKVHHFMKGIVGPGSKSIRAGLRGQGPATEKDWAQLEMHAALMAEASQLLTMGGRAKDSTWSTSAEALRKSATALAKAAASKEVAAARRALGQTGRSCGACHRKHRKKK